MRSELPTDLPPVGALPAQEQPVRGARNRKLLLAWWLSLPIVTVLLTLGVALLTLYCLSWSSLKKFETGDFAVTVAAYEKQTQLTNWGLEPWVARYNLGTALLASGETNAGIVWLEESFAGVPKAIPTPEGTIQTFSYECQVRTNLALGWETLGDQDQESGDLPGAVEKYDAALVWVSPCELTEAASVDADEEGPAGQPSAGTSDEASTPDIGASTTERIQEKRDSARGDSTGQPESASADGAAGGSAEGGMTDSGDDESDPFGNETSAEQARREQLLDKNQHHDEAQRQQEESANRYPGSRGW